MASGRLIDHIVLAVPDLQSAMQQFQETYGIQTHYGGQHKDFGTHNALVNIGCLLYTSPSPRDATLSRMPSSA